MLALFIKSFGVLVIWSQCYRLNFINQGRKYSFKLKSWSCRACTGIWKAKQGSSVESLLFFLNSWWTILCDFLVLRWVTKVQMVSGDVKTSEWATEWRTEGRDREDTQRRTNHPAKSQRASLPFTWCRKIWNANGVWKVKCEWTLSNWHGASASLPISFFSTSVIRENIPSFQLFLRNEELWWLDIPWIKRGCLSWFLSLSFTLGWERNRVGWVTERKGWVAPTL